MHRFLFVCLLAFLFTQEHFAPKVVGAELQYPLAIAAGETGPLFIADRNLPGVWKLTDGKLELVFQASKKFRTPLNAVRCLAVDKQGRLYAGDSATREVFRFNSENQPEPLTKGGVGIPMGIAFDKDGNILVADLEFPGRIVKIPEAGGSVSEIAQINAPRGISVDAEGRVVVVTHSKDRQVVRILPDGKIETWVSGRPFDFPQSITFDGSGTAYVADGYSKAVWKISADGKPETLVAEKGLSHPDCVVRQGENLFVVDPHAKKNNPQATGVFKVSLTGEISIVDLAAP